MLTIELNHFRTPGRVISTIGGWLEGNPRDMVHMIAGGQIDLSTLDPRLAGRAFLTRVSTNASRFTLKVSPPVIIDGRALEVGSQVRIEVGGRIIWNP
jgi:hypothetical protein